MKTKIPMTELRRLRKNAKDPKKHRRIVYNALYDLETYFDQEIEKRKP